MCPIIPTFVICDTVRMIYISRANRARASEVSSSHSMIERDGLHRIPDDTIYTDASGREDSICIMFQGRVLPYGDSQTKMDIEQTCAEIVATHFLGGKIDVSSRLDQILSWASKNGVTILLIMIGLTILASTLMGG